jgi:putative endonuclease
MYFVYILASDNRESLYIGVTSDLPRRLAEHQQGIVDSFSRRYHTHRLVYFESTGEVNDAIAREKQLKGWRRSKKEALIQAANPDWNDLSYLAFE